MTGGNWRDRLGWAYPTVLALFLAALSWPIVALTLQVSDTYEITGHIDVGYPVGGASIPARMAASGSAVFGAALVAGTLGGLVIGRHEKLGTWLTVTVGWLVAVLAAPWAQRSLVSGWPPVSGACACTSAVATPGSTPLTRSATRIQPCSGSGSARCSSQRPSSRWFWASRSGSACCVRQGVAGWWRQVVGSAGPTRELLLWTAACCALALFLPSGRVFVLSGLILGLWLLGMAVVLLRALARALSAHRCT